MELIEQPGTPGREPASGCHVVENARPVARMSQRVFCTREVMASRAHERPVTYIIDSGIGARFTLMPDGRRQFTELLLPGDVVGLELILNLCCADNVIALTTTVCRALVRADLSEPGCAHMLREALERQLLAANEWLLHLGARPALHRLAFFFHETLTRMGAPRIGNGVRCYLPLTQVELADFLALTPVHINRCLGILRSAGVVTFRGGRLEVHDLVKLRQYALSDEEPLT
jgi:CRP-like cAMP-binding protein